MTRRPDTETEKAWKAASAALKAIPGVGSGPMGLTPEHIRLSPEYRAAKTAYDRAFQAVRAENAKRARL